MTDHTTTDESERRDDTEAATDASDRTVSRRSVLAATAVAAGGVGFLAGETRAESAAAPAGTVGTASEPYKRVYMDRMVFVERTSDPASPADGTVWYNSQG